MPNNREVDKPEQLEAKVLQNLRMMTPEARAELLAISALYVESFPLHPILRLIRSSS
jgi:hypothetical protein